MRPSFLAGLVPATINLWLGCSRAGASSGLHHDFHDNLYVLLSGTKDFLLYSPADAARLYLQVTRRAAAPPLRCADAFARARARRATWRACTPTAWLRRRRVGRALCGARPTPRAAQINYTDHQTRIGAPPAPAARRRQRAALARACVCARVRWRVCAGRTDGADEQLVRERDLALANAEASVARAPHVRRA